MVKGLHVFCLLILQVCDDSTRESVRQKVDAAVISCLEQGHNVQLVRRDNRSGYKAGAMVDGMTRVEDQGFEFVAIFDADFEPPEDFLYQTIIHMVSSIAGCWNSNTNGNLCSTRLWDVEPCMAALTVPAANVNHSNSTDQYAER